MTLKPSVLPTAPAEADPGGALAAILNELRGLRADLAARHQASPGQSPDAVAAGAVFGDAEFTVVELVARAAADTELLSALEAVIGSIEQGGPRRLGHALGRAARTGPRLVRIGKAPAGAMWKVTS